MRKVLLLTVALLVLSAVPAEAAPRVTPGSRYLALGDSVTFGYQEAQVVPAPNYRSARSFTNYPRQLGSQLRLRVANPACPGETAASLIDERAQSNGCENSRGSATGYRDLFPLHVRYSGSQLAYAVRYLRRHPRTRLVSLMIGANDFFLCQSSAPNHCLAESEQTTVFTAIRRNVRRIVRTIRRKARYRGQLAIVHYYSLNFSSAFVNGFVQSINRAQDLGARGYHARVADGYGEFQRASAHSGGSPCNAGLLNQLNAHPGRCGVHPSYSGQALLAQAVQKAIRLR
jgi:lysophospholipase L1-like esterase